MAGEIRSFEEKFFFIDKDNYEDVKNNFYGYAVLNEKIIEKEESSQVAEEELTYAGGCFCAVSNLKGKITIRHDYYGYMGLYCYRKNDYFAISNSLLLLIEKVKNRGVSLNKNVMNCNLTAAFIYPMCRETIVKEIYAVRPEEEVHIDKGSATMEIIMSVRKAGNIKVDSCEGLYLLDGWYEKWIRIIRNLYEKNKSVAVDLTGGIDSRMVFSLFLNSNVDMKGIHVISFKDGKHTHSEDFKIAMTLSEAHHFELNNGINDIEKHTSDEMLQISMYTRLGVHKELYYKQGKYRQTRYHFTGSGGERIRGYWGHSKDFFKAIEKKTAQAEYMNDSAELIDSIDFEYDKTFRYLEEKYNIRESNQIGSYLWNDVADAIHFGTLAQEAYIMNEVLLSPFADPMLSRLKLVGDDIDNKLLTALIFVRYKPELLNVRFDSGHTIPKIAIEKAQEINQRFPWKKPQKEIMERAKIEEAVQQKAGGKGNVQSNNEINNEFVWECFCSEKLRADILAIASNTLYGGAGYDAMCRDYFPLSNVYPLLIAAYISSGDTESIYEYLKKCHEETTDISCKEILTFAVTRNKEYEDVKKRDNWIMRLYSGWVRNPGVIERYLERSHFERIAIYGAGRLGKDIAEVIEKSGKKVEYVIDRDVSRRIGQYKVFSPEGNLPDADLILSTVAMDFDSIEAALKEKTDIKIVSIEQIIFE